MRSIFVFSISLLISISSAFAHHEETYTFDIPAADFQIAQTSTKTAAEISADIRASQKLLSELGYFSGSANGKESAALEKAVRAFQKDRKLKVSGKVSGTLVKSLEKAKTKAVQHTKRVAVVEKMLKQLDYKPGSMDGREDATLTKAIKAFQTDKKSKAKKKGIVNGTLIRSLRTTLEAKGLTPPKEAYTLSSADGSKAKKSTAKKKTSTKTKSTSGSSTTKAKADKSKTDKDSKDDKKSDTNKSTKKSSAKKETSKSSSKEKTKKCSSKKEMVAGKCVTKCKSGYKRDTKTNKCKKVAAKKKTTKKSSSATKTTAKCKSGYEKVSGKCKKKCKTGQKRDSKSGRCKKK